MRTLTRLPSGAPHPEFQAQEEERQRLAAGVDEEAPPRTAINKMASISVRTPALAQKSPARSAEPNAAAEEGRTYSPEEVLLVLPGDNGCQLTFHAREIDINEISISIWYDDPIRFVPNGPMDLMLRMRGEEFPVSWAGGCFEFTNSKINGISFLRRAEAKV